MDARKVVFKLRLYSSRNDPNSVPKMAVASSLQELLQKGNLFKYN